MNRRSAQIMGKPIVFANLVQGQLTIGASDYYSRNLTEFDLKAKIQTLSTVTEADYLQNATKYVRDWTPDEVVYLTDVIALVDEKIKALGLAVDLPDEILLIKTTGQEEGGAKGYTRKNAIFLNRNSLSPDLFIHELYHVISRFNEARASDAYAILGFRPCNSIAYEDELRITNPDAPYLRHYIDVTIGGSVESVVLIMRSEREYGGGSFFRYINKKLLVVEGDGANKSVKLRHDRPILLDYREPIDLYDQIGRNTAYNIHQEEVSAVHFEMLVLGEDRLANAAPITQLRKVLS